MWAKTLKFLIKFINFFSLFLVRRSNFFRPINFAWRFEIASGLYYIAFKAGDIENGEWCPSRRQNFRIVQNDDDGVFWYFCLPVPQTLPHSYHRQ